MFARCLLDRVNTLFSETDVMTRGGVTKLHSWRRSSYWCRRVIKLR